MLYLISFHFDEFFQAIDDEDVIVFVADGYVPGAEEAVAVETLSGGLFVFVIAFHDLWAG